MTTIKATHCDQEVSLRPEEIELRVGEGEKRAEAYYHFTCSFCSQYVKKPADEKVVRLLTSGGVAVLPLLLAKSSSRYCGPPLTRDDLLDFHQLVNEPNGWDRWYKKLCRSRKEQSGAT